MEKTERAGGLFLCFMCSFIMLKKKTLGQGWNNEVRVHVCSDRYVLVLCLNWERKLLHTSQNHIITKCLRLEWAFRGHLDQPLPQEGSPGVSFPGLCPGGFWITPRVETPRPSWATYSCVQSPSQ